MLFTHADPVRPIEFNALNFILSIPQYAGAYLYNLYERKHVTLNQLLNAVFETNNACITQKESGKIEVINRDTKIVFDVSKATAEVCWVGSQQKGNSRANHYNNYQRLHSVHTIDLTHGFIKEKLSFKGDKKIHLDKTTRFESRAGYTHTTVREFFDNHSPDILLSAETCFDEDGILNSTYLSEKGSRTVTTEQVNANLAIRKSVKSDNCGNNCLTSYIDGEGRVTDITGDRHSTTLTYGLESKFDFITSSVYTSGRNTPFGIMVRSSYAYYTLDEQGRVTEVNIKHKEKTDKPFPDLTFKFEQPVWAV